MSFEIPSSEMDDEYLINHIIHLHPLNEANNPDKYSKLMKRSAADDIEIVHETVPAYSLVNSIEKEKEKSILNRKLHANDKGIRFRNHQTHNKNKEVLERVARDGNKNNHKKSIKTGPKIWDQWGKWSSCTVSCGIGKLTRWRHCVQGGCNSGEKEAQIKTCTSPAC